MRALYQPDLAEQAEYLISGEAHHHLVNVVRIELKEEILLLNGKGLSIIAEVDSISKKAIQLRFLRVHCKDSQLSYDLALGIPKKDALELCLKQATELGFRKIFLVRSEFSQTRLPEAHRLQSLLISALEQSNAVYMPELVPIINWQEIPWQDYQSALLLSSQSKSSTKISDKAARLLIIGPEGGFSVTELDYFNSKSEIEVRHLPTPILRTSTAVAAGAGILLERLMD